MSNRSSSTRTAAAKIADRTEVRRAGRNSNAGKTAKKGKNKNSSEIRFPARLHYVMKTLEKEGKSDLLGWTNDGKAFKIGDRDRLVKEVLPK